MSELKSLTSVLPTSSAPIYTKWYKDFCIFRRTHDVENKQDVDIVLESYVQYLIDSGMRANTITSKLTGIFKLLTLTENHYVNKVSSCRIKGALKNHAKNCGVVKKSKVLTDKNCRDFLNCPYDDLYTLQLKVALIVGIFGGLRHGEIHNLKKRNLTIFENYASVRVEMSKTDRNGEGYDGVVPLQDGNVGLRNILTTYYGLLVGDEDMPLFPTVKDFKFSSTRSGERRISNWPREIAKMLNLPDYEFYTGHSFRRTMATLAAENGATTDELMVQGRWKSHVVVGRYVDNSISKKLKIATKTLVLSPKNNAITSHTESNAQNQAALNKLAPGILGNCTITNLVVNIDKHKKKSVKKAHKHHKHHEHHKHSKK